MNKRFEIKKVPLTEGKGEIMEPFVNPYNFVPVQNNFFEADWARLVSHDIPFSDGITGEIHVDFEAVSPLIIKEGKSHDFVNFDSKPFIPSTSLKGMVRNVLEILSLSKISTLTKDDRYSMRDLSPYNKDYTIKKKLNEIKAGLLIQINGHFNLIECAEYERLNYKQLEELLDEPGIGNKIKNSSSVKEKYKLIDERPFYENEEDSDWVMVLTGKMFNKKAEYGFKLPDIISPVYIPEKVIKGFKFIYEKETDSTTWKFWKSKIQNFESIPQKSEITKKICFAPVFFIKEKTEIKHLGLTFLYREPYQFSVHQLIPEKHLEKSKFDLAETIFGSTVNESFKGRVSYSHAFIHDFRIEQEREIVLGSPKPTFFPFYLEQDSKKPFSTFSNSDSKINGWKRYLSQQDTELKVFNNDNLNIRTKIKPLSKGCKFTSVVRFHNLREVELGALLSALTFHNNQEKCFHLIGMAKPLGYGKIKLNNLKLNCSNAGYEPITLMAKFEKAICDKIFEGNFDKWSESVAKLFEFAQQRNDSKIVRYPKAFNEFKTIKNKNMNINDFIPKLSFFKLERLNH
jgi:CRISPR-associated protein (TIGR03986 family)